MAERVELLLIGDPTPKARPRVVRRGDTVQTYTPRPTVLAMGDIRRLYITRYGEQVTFGKGVPVRLMVTFTFARPPSAPKKRRYPAVKPDVTNLLQLVADALSKWAITDDAQIVEVLARKGYGPLPQTHIVVEAIKGEP